MQTLHLISLQMTLKTPCITLHTKKAQKPISKFKTIATLAPQNRSEFMTRSTLNLKKVWIFMSCFTFEILKMMETRTPH